MEQIENRLARYARAKRLKGAARNRYIYGTMNHILTAQKKMGSGRRKRRK
jgi:hypothetical protein